MKSIFLTALIAIVTTATPAFAGSQILSKQELKRIFDSYDRDPAFIKREYVRNGETVVTLTWTRHKHGMLVEINADGVLKEKREKFFSKFMSLLNASLEEKSSAKYEDKPKGSAAFHLVIPKGASNSLPSSVASTFFLGADDVLNIILENVITRETTENTDEERF